MEGKNTFANLMEDSSDPLTDLMRDSSDFFFAFMDQSDPPAENDDDWLDLLLAVPKQTETMEPSTKKLKGEAFDFDNLDFDDLENFDFDNLDFGNLDFNTVPSPPFVTWVTKK